MSAFGVRDLLLLERRLTGRLVPWLYLLGVVAGLVLALARLSAAVAKLRYDLLGGAGEMLVVGVLLVGTWCAWRVVCEAALTGQAIHDRLAPIFKAAFIESNPSPTKFLLSRMGICANELRLPLVPVEPASETAILAAAEKVGVKLASAVYA